MPNNEIVEYTPYKCIKCNASIPKKKANAQGKQRTRFCSIKCTHRFYSLRKYYQSKNDKEYKLKRKQYFSKWYEKNRLPFIERMKKYQKERIAKKKSLEKKRSNQ